MNLDRYDHRRFMNQRHEIDSPLPKRSIIPAPTLTAPVIPPRPGAIIIPEVPAEPSLAAKVGNITRSTTLVGDPEVLMDGPLIAQATARVSGLSGKLYVGINNGTTGAMAGLSPDGRILCRPVEVMRLGNEKLMDIERNLDLLRLIIRWSGQSGPNVLVVFEQAQIAPRFGARNNYTNGKNNEFWRVLLSTAKIPFCWVNPKDWQRDVFRGIRGDDTKVMAELVCRQRFPDSDFRAYNRSQREGIHDALCIALWAREVCK